MRILITLLLCFQSSLFLMYAQKESNWWYFGKGSGLNFNQLQSVIDTDGEQVLNMPTPVLGPIQTNGGSATVSDGKGNLLFSSDSRSVYDKDNKLIDNGLKGYITGAQPVVIIPRPGVQGRYYIISNAQFGSASGGIYYSELDINEDSGSGKLLSKNRPLSVNNLFETFFLYDNMTVVLHDNGRHYWLLNRTAKYLLAWLVTEDGISYSPEVSIIPNTTASLNGSMGYLSVSNDGAKLCHVYLGQEELLFADFSTLTGKISNIIVRKSGIKSMYSAVFSPQGKNLFISGTTAYMRVIPTNDIATADFTMLSEKLGARGVGPDGNIYIIDSSKVPYNSRTLGVIQNPDADIPELKIHLFNSYLLASSYYGLSAMNPETYRAFDLSSKGFSCAGHSSEYTIEVNSFHVEDLAYIQWDFGDGSPVVKDSNLDEKIHSFSHAYAESGEYTITITPVTNNGEIIAHKKVTLSALVRDCPLGVNRSIRSNLKGSLGIKR